MGLEQNQHIDRATQIKDVAAQDMKSTILSRLSEVDPKDFPKTYVCVDEKGQVEEGPGVWVNINHTDHLSGASSALVLTPEGLYISKVRGVHTYYNSLPSYYVFETFDFQEPSVDDYLKYGPEALKKLEEELARQRQVVA